MKKQASTSQQTITQLNKEQQKFRIDKILDVKGRDHEIEYLVQWVDNNDIKTTWEPPEHLKKHKKLLEEFRSHKMIKDMKKLHEEKKNQLPYNKKTSNQITTESNRLKTVVKPNILNPKPKITEISEIDKNYENDGSDTQFLEELIEKLDLNAKEEYVSDKKQTESDINILKPIKQKLTSIIDKWDKRSIRPLENTQDLDKTVGHELVTLNKLEDGTKYVTTDQISDSVTKNILLTDLTKAIKVKKPIILQNKLYFILLWDDKRTNDFYDKHYFSLNELEEYNPTILLDYYKEHLKKYFICN